MTLKVIVTQIGARRNYAVPRMLHARGALDHLYTDFCIKGGLGEWATATAGRLSPALGAKLRRRTVRGVPGSRVRSAPMVNLKPALKRGLRPEERYTLANELLGEAMIAWGVGDANVVYGMYNSGSPFWRHAKGRGLKVAIDVFITPLYQSIVARELAAYPDWEPPGEEDGADQALIEARIRETIETADVLLCPAANVRDDLVAFAAQAGIKTVPRIVVAPYGSSTSQVPIVPATVPGRILFAGQAVLRKGIHYFAAAANKLSGGAASFSFRVAGHASERVRGHGEARNLVFLGQLSRDELRAEYAKADLFVLPTLAEGSAAVVHEALAAGLPVVTTHSAGSVVTHGQEGLIVPERDSAALAAAIETIVGDRGLRAAMSQAAKTTAADYGEGPWADRMIAALGSLLNAPVVSPGPEIVRA